MSDSGILAERSSGIGTDDNDTISKLISYSDSNSDDPSMDADALCILIIDDDESDQKIISRMLMQADLSINTDCVSNLTDALIILTTQKFDVILLDYLLPDGVSGPEHIIEMRRIAQDTQLPFIVLTGFSDEKKVVESFRDGASDYIAKGNMSPGSLFRAVSNAVKKAHLERVNDRNSRMILKANDTLTQQKKQISSFYQTVSHELKSPLTGAREYTSLLRDGIAGPVSDQQAEMLDMVLRCCDTLTDLINDLVDTASIENGKLSISKKEIDIAQVVSDCSTRYLSQAADKGLNIQVDVAKALPLIRADSLRMDQLASNLISNAIRYSDKPGNILVSLTLDTTSRWLTLSVKDTGQGIASDDISRIFEKFHQVDNDHSSKGMGLGLFLCQKIVNLHDGELLVQSELGVGSEFRALLPLHPTQGDRVND